MQGIDSHLLYCMEDENQRRAWEYLHGLSRRDGSHGKVLADALIAAIDSQNDTQNTVIKRFSGEQNGDSNDELRAISNEIAGLVLEGITDYFADKAVLQSTEQMVCKAEISKQEQKRDIAEDMLDFAFAMGE
ncbi:MAG: hypothetical protein K2O91_15630 [Lachnospiraceae bacterium]|nr:hypothetical protein [Lachnospiraceae bacterium]